MIDGSEDGFPFVLVGQIAVRAAVRREGGGEDETADVVVPLVARHPVP